uniref:Cnd3 domain-containing protein n=1 Tax=Angiostrongylus cantonensis TaxID=6313 RepID=A0A0K0DR90_ANGCA
LKAACKHYGKDILGEEDVNIIKQLRHNGATREDILHEVDEMIEEIADPKRKMKASRLATICKKIYSRGRSRRSHHHHHNHSLDFTFQKYLTWLDDSQKDELKKMKESGHKEEMYEKIRQYFEVASGGVKEKAVEELQSACKHYIKEFVGEEKAATLKTMKEAGTPFDEIAKEVTQAIEQIPDEAVKSRARAASNLCRKVFGVTKRLRRDHKHKHSLEEAMDKYLSWLTDDQKIVIKSIYDVGDRNALYEKVMEFFNDAAGEVKGKATSELKDACKHYVKDLIGEENGNLLSEMKETGASNDAIATKVEEMIEAINDETRKEQAIKASTACRKIYGVEKRLKRDHHHEHSLKEALEKYLTWLNNEQKAEVKTIYEGGDREAVYKKVLEFFDAATGETKEKASMELKSACKHYIEDFIGKENAEKIKEMKESGVSKEEIAAKVDEFIEKITDEEKKAKALRASAACKKFYGVAKRFRRDHHHHEHNLEEALEKYLTWLNDEQKAEVKKIYEGGDKEAVNKKVLEFFDAATGETKEKASMELKSACKHYIEYSIGKENAEKIKEMKESGVSKEEIAAKVEEFIAKITDEEKKAKALRASAACKKIYGVAKRFRRDHHHDANKFEEAMQKYLSWLNDEQKTQVRKIYGTGDRIATYNEVMEMFESASGDKKVKATSQLKAACRHYIKHFIGDQNVEVIKIMKQNGATSEAISSKIDEFIADLKDEKKKGQAEKVATACKKIYGIKNRNKRNEHEIKLEEALTTYLTWLNEKQKTELKQLKENNQKEAIHTKIMEYFETATGDVKDKAREELKNGCKHYFKLFLGEEKTDELKALKDSGASMEEMLKKLNEAIETIADETLKAKAQKVSASCQKIYGVPKVRRHLAAKYHRHHPRHHHFFNE